MNKAAPNPYAADSDAVGEFIAEPLRLKSSTFLTYAFSIAAIATALGSLSMIPPNYPGSLVVHPTVVGSEIVIMLITLVLAWRQFGKRMSFGEAMIGSQIVSFLAWAVVCGSLALFMDGGDNIFHFITFASISACIATVTTWLAWRKHVKQNPDRQQEL